MHFIHAFTSEQSEHGYSIHEQEQVLISENFPGYDYETYTDSGISKNIEGRPAMKRLLQDVKDNKIEMLSWKLNRISRSMRRV